MFCWICSIKPHLLTGLFASATHLLSATFFVTIFIVFIDVDAFILSFTLIIGYANAISSAITLFSHTFSYMPLYPDFHEQRDS